MIVVYFPLLHWLIVRAAEEIKEFIEVLDGTLKMW